ncbi:serine hydrolase [Nonomuraea sp. B19D2]|uniref:serine hydrolase n=1 Tax=Nonomuraea sp. B19D2 TaxID=3159561 RepID=UPI0032DA7CD9
MVRRRPASHPRRCPARALQRQPDQAVEYTDRSAIILGWLAEYLTATPLDQLAQNRTWRPLGMSRTCFAA